jgi:hypothetical protein
MILSHTYKLKPQIFNMRLKKPDSGKNTSKRKDGYSKRPWWTDGEDFSTNLPNLFTYQKYPELDIPNTTNSFDGSFSALKKKLGVHHGLRRDRWYKVISKLLRDGA